MHIINIDGLKKIMIINSKAVNIGSFIQRHFAKILALIYILAIFYPVPGIFADQYSFLHVQLPDKQGFNLTTPMILLGFIVLNAALSINIKELFKVHKNIPIVILAILANFILGIIFFLIIKVPIGLLLSNDNFQQIIIAIAILTSVPIAGTATAWTQTIKGNVTLTLQILLITTLLSPIFVPLILKLFSNFTTGKYAERMLVLANKDIDFFLIIIVVIPAIIGLIINLFLKEATISGFMPVIKILNQFYLLFLIYINASVILPDIFFKNNDMVMVLTSLFLAIVYCFLSYFMGWIISIMFSSQIRDEIALIFSEGMKNVGAGLVIAQFGFSQYPNVGLLIIFFAVAQQFMASFVKYFEYRKLLFIKNNDTKLACIIDPDCKD